MVTAAVRPSADNTPAVEALLNARLRWLTPRRLLLSMIALQMVWLAIIWYTGAATAAYKLLPLMLYTAVTGLLITFMPQRAEMSLQRLLRHLSLHEKQALLLLAALLLVGGGYYASQQRLWPFDEEASYEAAVTVARHGIPGLLASYENWDWLANQHPPLAPILYGQFVRLLGERLFIARFVSLLCALATGLFTYLVGTELYDKKTGLLAACFLFTFPLLMRLSTAAMVESLLTFFFTLTLYLGLLWARRHTWPYLLALSLTVGLGLLTKYTMLFVLPILLGVVVWHGSRRQIAQLSLMLVLVCLSFGATWLLAASRIDVLQTQWETVGHYAGLVLTNTYGRDLLFETLTNRLPSALGLYNLPLIALGALLLLWRRSRADGLILLWVTAVWLPLLLTLPDHRYFMSSFPAVAILIAAGSTLTPQTRARTLLLASLYAGGALYLFIDWARAAQIFLQ